MRDQYRSAFSASRCGCKMTWPRNFDRGTLHTSRKNRIMICMLCGSLFVKSTVPRFVFDPSPQYRATPMRNSWSCVISVMSATACSKNGRRRARSFRNRACRRRSMDSMERPRSDNLFLCCADNSMSFVQRLTLLFAIPNVLTISFIEYPCRRNARALSRSTFFIDS